MLMKLMLLRKIWLFCLRLFWIIIILNLTIIYEVGSWTYTGVVFDGMVVLC